MGNKGIIDGIIRDNELELNHVTVIDPDSEEEKERVERFAQLLFRKRQRKGITLNAAMDLITHPNYFSTMLLETGEADAVLSGLTLNYPETIRPALQVIGRKPDVGIVSGMYIVSAKEGPLFLSDCTVNPEPNVEELVEITLQTAEAVRRFRIEPVIALLSYSNFGSVRGYLPEMLQEVVRILHRDHPDLVVDGEMQANTALDPELMEESVPFSKLINKEVNTLIFPDLASANIAYKLLNKVGHYEIIGPVLNGMNKPVHVLQMGSSVNEIVQMVMIAVLDAQNR